MPLSLCQHMTMSCTPSQLTPVTEENVPSGCMLAGRCNGRNVDISFVESPGADTELTLTLTSRAEIY